MSMETPMVDFTCDKCNESLAIEMEWRARSYNDEVGYFDIKETEQKLIDEDGWMVYNDGDEMIHICCDCK